MRWYRSLTTNQRAILLGLTLSVIIVIGLLGWNIWSTLQARPGAPYPTLAAISPLPEQISPLPSPTATATLPPVTEEPSFDVTKAGIIAERVAEARHAHTRWGTPLTLVDGADMARAIYTHYHNRLPLPWRAQTVLTAFHLWRWERLRLDAVGQSKRVAAFYAPESEDLYLRREWDGPLQILETQLAYGYARALPDQYGNITTLAAEAGSLDQQLAINAVAEGDALVAVLLYKGVAPGSTPANEIKAQTIPAVCPFWQTEDPLLEKLSCLTLNLGSSFALSRYQENGLSTLDQVILRPPRSTEQILHPERYTISDEPRILTPITPPLAREWVLTTTETVGEALIRIILSEWGTGTIPHTMGLDWGGDLLQIWEGPDGRTVMAWQTAWDSGQAAGRFYSQLLKVMPAPLVPGLIRDTVPSADLPRGRWWSGNQGAVFLYRWGDNVWLLWGQDPKTVQIVGKAITLTP